MIWAQRFDEFHNSFRIHNFNAIITRLGLLLYELLPQCGMEAICLWHCFSVMEAQVALIGAFRSSALLQMVSFIFFLKAVHRFLLSSGQGSLLANQAQQLYSHWTAFRVLWQCGPANSARKWNFHTAFFLSKGKCLYWQWMLENAVGQHQPMTWLLKSSLIMETSLWTSSIVNSLPFCSTSRLWDLHFQMKCKLFCLLLRGFWNWVTVFFLLAEVKISLFPR